MRSRLTVKSLIWQEILVFIYNYHLWASPTRYGANRPQFKVHRSNINRSHVVSKQGRTINLMKV